jgi:hypothetical protein
LSNKRDTAEYLGSGIGNESSSESSPASENEEWAWMVAEDPAFYLSRSGRAETTGE